MKKIEFNPDVQSTAFFRDQASLNDIFLEILPVIFHKLKNKLTPIIGYTQILKSRSSDAFLLERLAKIENNANELTVLLNVLKDYFQIEAKPKRSGNINRIVEKLKPGLQKTAAACRADLHLDLSAAIPNLPLHSGQIELLLLNLVANALTALRMKAASQKDIFLSSRLEDGRVKLVIRDNGIGMAADDLDNIWAPFYAKFENGAGLGLLICEKVIANHGATCQVRSRAGEFTEFEIAFTLPEKPQKKKSKIGSSEQTEKK